VDGGLIRAAHADAWEAHGRYRAGDGGGAERMAGIRLMATGLPHPQWNNGDGEDGAAVDIDAVRAWYAERRVPWGVRVPAGMRWPHGRHLFRKRLMGLAAERFVPATPPADVTLRVAGAEDIDGVLAVDTIAFEEPVEVERGWIAPLLTQPGMTVCLAEIGGEPVGAGNALRSDGDAGAALYVAGIGVLPAARGRGIGAAVSSWLVERGVAGGAALAHLHPDTDEAARIYTRLGFVEVDGFDVYVDLA
jgi:ribosomal protein S18 acetylase RimI-like enzyme